MPGGAARASRGSRQGSRRRSTLRPSRPRARARGEHATRAGRAARGRARGPHSAPALPRSNARPARSIPGLDHPRARLDIARAASCDRRCDPASPRASSNGRGSPAAEQLGGSKGDRGVDPLVAVAEPECERHRALRPPDHAFGVAVVRRDERHRRRRVGQEHALGHGPEHLDRARGGLIGLGQQAATRQVRHEPAAGGSLAIDRSGTAVMLDRPLELRDRGDLVVGEIEGVGPPLEQRRALFRSEVGREAERSVVVRRCLAVRAEPGGLLGGSRREGSTASASAADSAYGRAVRVRVVRCVGEGEQNRAVQGQATGRRKRLLEAVTRASSWRKATPPSPRAEHASGEAFVDRVGRVAADGEESSASSGGRRDRRCLDHRDRRALSLRDSCEHDVAHRGGDGGATGGEHLGHVERVAARQVVEGARGDAVLRRELATASRDSGRASRRRTACAVASSPSTIRSGCVAVELVVAERRERQRATCRPPSCRAHARRRASPRRPSGRPPARARAASDGHPRRGARQRSRAHHQRRSLRRPRSVPRRRSRGWARAAAA